MISGGITETIWHFAGYLRLFQDVAREQDLYLGDPQPKLPEEDPVAASDTPRRFTDDELPSQPIQFRAQPLPDPGHSIQNATIPPYVPPKVSLTGSPSLPKRLEPSDDIDMQIGLRIGAKLIAVDYQDGGTQGLLSLHQFNHATDRDLLTSDAIRNPDGTLVVPAELDLDDAFNAMLQQADQAVPSGLPDIGSGGTQSVLDAFVARDARWAETGSPNPDGSPAQHAPMGRIVDGVAGGNEPQAPTILQIAPWRPTEDAPAEQVTKVVTAAEPTGGVAVLAETGLNTQINAAVIIDGNEATGSMIVGGDYFFSRGIVQVNILVDNDHVDIAVAGALMPAVQVQGNEVHNIAEFITHEMTIEPNGAASTPFWSVSVVSGNFYDVKTIVQFNGLDDNDRIVQAESGTYFEVKSGGTQQINFAKVLGLDSYDVIIIGGDYHRADWIFQYNIMLDSDSAKLYATGEAGDDTTVTTGFNQLTNIAEISTYDAAAFKPMLAAHHDLLAALEGRITILTPNADWDLNGNRSGTLSVLFVSGDYYDINTITQVNTLVDADQAINANAENGTSQGVAAGGNIALNEAQIVDPGTLSASNYLGGDAYEESVLIQVNMITDSDTVIIHDTNTLVPELIVFAQQAEAPAGSDSVEARPVVVDPAQHDHLMSNMLT